MQPKISDFDSNASYYILQCFSKLILKKVNFLAVTFLSSHHDLHHKIYVREHTWPTKHRSPCQSGHSDQNLGCLHQCFCNLGFPWGEYWQLQDWFPCHVAHLILPTLRLRCLPSCEESFVQQVSGNRFLSSTLLRLPLGLGFTCVGPRITKPGLVCHKIAFIKWHVFPTLWTSRPLQGQRRKFIYLSIYFKT